MRRSGWGRIVNIAGAAGTSPERGNLPVSLANIAVLNMTRALSDAVAGDGILVNTICPGLTNTERARRLHATRAAEEGRDVDELIAEAGRGLPAGRIAEPEEIAEVAVFLASGACSYVFGSSVYMDGGSRRGTP
jgi:NAD(P)-dependent dehydrogenase (short-subunit alcohol dehydrogenase family)